MQDLYINSMIYPPPVCEGCVWFGALATEILDFVGFGGAI